MNADLKPDQHAIATRSLDLHWVVDGPLFAGGGEYMSPVASSRYRVLLPARALESRGHRVTITPLKYVVEHAALPGSKPDLLIIGKPFSYNDAVTKAVMQVIDAVQAKGTRVLCDVVDDHFTRSDAGDYWQQLTARVDMCVTGTETMAATLRRYTQVPTVVIGDALAAPKGEPRHYTERARGGLRGMLRRDPLKLVWYGIFNNILSMERWAFALAPLMQEIPVEIKIITNHHPSVDQLVATFNKRFGSKGHMEFVHWSEEAQWAAVAASDVVLIPADLSHPQKAVKTANRLTDALHSGRYAIAAPVPSYLPYAAFADLTEDPVEALRWYLAHPEDSRDRMLAGQEAVVRDWSPDSIVAKWLDIFEQADGQERRSSASHRSVTLPVRLNLGCGDKILPGYVNVDVVESRAGKKPDVLCDLHRLTPFGDAHADEVMAIHVVEHFWRWEVEAILREWIRVLKPGGRLVLECPNLESACEEFLRDPDLMSSEGSAGQTTMWVFYGDPAWRDPLMVHRWGYTPKSLSRLLESVGLVDVGQEPAQFKLKEPRDMRIVGVKPA